MQMVKNLRVIFAMTLGGLLASCASQTKQGVSSSALIGTNTIDLYKPSRLDMKRWGVRRVDIDILQWGSNAQSLKVLTPRAKHGYVRKMVVALQKKSSGRPGALELN